MTEQKQIMDKEIEEKKLEKPVEEVSNVLNKDEKTTQTSKTLNQKPVEDTKTNEDNKELEKKEEKPAEPVVKGNKKEAVVNGKDLRISTKHSVAISNFIRGKDIDVAIIELEQVEKMKKAIPMRGEIPHRKGMMSGRYPVKASGEFIKLLKSLKANALYHDLELEKCKLACIPNVAARPQKRHGRARFKRSHVQLKLIPITKVKKKKNKTQEKKSGGNKE
jgi:large subunit ribosomal protein L22